MENKVGPLRLFRNEKCKYKQCPHSPFSFHDSDCIALGLRVKKTEISAALFYGFIGSRNTVLLLFMRPS